MWCADGFWGMRPRGGARFLRAGVPRRAAVRGTSGHCGPGPAMAAWPPLLHAAEGTDIPVPSAGAAAVKGPGSEAAAAGITGMRAIWGLPAAVSERIMNICAIPYPD